MKNSLFNYFKSKLKLEIKGKNIERFIHKLASNKIELLNIKNIKRDTVEIIIYKDDYQKLMNLKSIYEVNVVGAKGLIKIRKLISINKILIFSIALGLALLKFLTNIIFKVEVIHSSSEIRTFLTNELKNYGLDKYTMKKSFKELQKIKNQIIDKYPDKIEWIEIEAQGVKYVVKVELRELPDKKEELKNRNVVAKKDALIKLVTAKKGQIVKNKNTYVKKGDVIISGDISLNEEKKGTTSADGKVYGEVWYTVTVDYPFNYYEEILTGKSKNVISLKFLNRSINFFSSFKNKKVIGKTIIENKLLPIKLIYEHQEEVKVVDQILTEEQAINKAIEKGIEQINMELEDDEHIIKNKVLKVDIKENEVSVDIFFSIYEDITDYAEIIEEQIPENIIKENN